LTSSIEHAIPGDYQLRALQQGWRLQRAWHRARLDLISQVLPPAPDGLILDAASGSGIVTWRFRERRIVNADMRVSACAVTRRHTTGARAVAAVVDALPFSSGTFAQAYFLEAIEHLGEDEGVRALREIARVCRPGGACLMTTPNYRSHWRLIESALDRWGPTPPLGDAQHVTKYDAARLRQTAEAAGWTVTRLGSFNLIAPIAGVLSARLGGWLTGLEASRLRFSGPLLFAVCRRK
jgi:ubiquinone/menaquinone biosynthesis C-methylase UbiE